MKTLISVLAFTMMSSAFAAAFSPEELLGTHASTDCKAVIKVYKEIAKERTLFEPAVYAYYVDFKFDDGPSMKMYGNDDSKVTVKKADFSYNGSWLPKTEYLSAGYSEDVDYDGAVYIESASLRATKSHKQGKSTVKLELEFSVGHNPDGGDGEDGGVAEFDRCSKKTVSSWTRFTKIK